MTSLCTPLPHALAKRCLWKFPVERDVLPENTLGGRSPVLQRYERISNLFHSGIVLSLGHYGLNGLVRGHQSSGGSPSLFDCHLIPSRKLFNLQGLDGGRDCVDRSQNTRFLPWGRSHWRKLRQFPNIKEFSGFSSHLVMNSAWSLSHRHRIIVSTVLAASQAVEDAKELGRPDIPTIKVGKTYPKIYKYVIYLVPTFSNPSVKALCPQTRKDLVALAREYDALVVSDDVYDFLSWPEDSSTPDDAVEAVPPRLVDIDRNMPGYSTWGNTLSNGSFSKVIGPGVRVGWADGTPAFARELAEVGSSSSGGAPSHLTSTFVDKMLRSGSLQTHIKKTLIPTYRERYRALMAYIRDILVLLGVTVETNNPEDAAQATTGGFFTYLRLPEDLPVARTVAAIALKEKFLRVVFGHMFVISGDKGSVQTAESKNSFSRCIRLCRAWHEVAELEEGIERLAATILDIRSRLEAVENMSEQVSIGIR
ncbi:aminotransferase [Colletotrichum cuscutae]|uniref:Aminotransferase n=1 Tax=Colletotrichum cuscutae TaxID=1209917 RepID=A0AAI9Y2A8_9PEZI|nr:aminotransferase [Colletotrichum cuscutae]